MVGAINKQQAAVDAAVRAAKDRMSLVHLAERGQIAPESLTVEEIRRVCDFAVDHAECAEPGRAT